MSAECGGLIDSIRSWASTAAVSLRDAFRSIEVELPENLGRVNVYEVISDVSLSMLLGKLFPQQYITKPKELEKLNDRIIGGIYSYSINLSQNAMLFVTLATIGGGASMGELMNIAGFDKNCITKDNSEIVKPYNFIYAYFLLVPLKKTVLLGAILTFESGGRPLTYDDIFNYLIRNSVNNVVAFKAFRRLMNSLRMYYLMLYYNAQGVTSIPFIEITQSIKNVVRELRRF
jgi:hypothetical protein